MCCSEMGISLISSGLFVFFKLDTYCQNAPAPQLEINL